MISPQMTSVYNMDTGISQKVEEKILIGAGSSAALAGIPTWFIGGNTTAIKIAVDAVLFVASA